MKESEALDARRVMGGFKPKDRVRCIDDSPVVLTSSGLTNVGPCELVVGDEYHIEYVGDEYEGGAPTCRLSEKPGRWWRVDRFELVTPPRIHVHEGRRYRELGRSIATTTGNLVVIAEAIPFARDEIVDRAALALRNRLAAAHPGVWFSENAIDAAVASVVDDLVGWDR